MPDIYNEFTAQETTSALLDSNRLVNFAYDDKAFNENDTEGRAVYNYNANNNIPLSTGLSTQTQTLGFGGKSGVFKRLFWNHTAGRISYNLNKAIQALRNILGSFRSDYSENISEYSEYAVYRKGDVCYRLSGDAITFYRCKQAPSSPGPFNGIYWEKPEEERSHNRPAVGVPVLWFEKVPDDATLRIGKGWAIRFDDGAHHTWEECPALNFEQFREMVTVDDDDNGFTVPDYSERVPMFTGGTNEVLSGYDGDEFDACLENHAHGAPTLTFTLPAESFSHTHPNKESGGSGNHQHEIPERCNYDGASNRVRTRLPVDDISRYNPATLTNYDGAHTHSTASSSAICDAAGVADHYHDVTVTGATGAVKGETGGNPDSFQCCWIVRYK